MNQLRIREHMVWAQPFLLKRKKGSFYRNRGPGNPVKDKRRQWYEWGSKREAFCSVQFPAPISAVDLEILHSWSDWKSHSRPQRLAAPSASVFILVYQSSKHTEYLLQFCFCVQSFLNEIIFLVDAHIMVRMWDCQESSIQELKSSDTNSLKPNSFVS